MITDFEHQNIISPAKINLTLRVLGRMANGYHQLQTYFLLLNWGDTMSFNQQNQSEINITGNFGDLKQEDNLIHKALVKLLPYRKKDFGVHIHVTKNIPQGSGLGGGSSNAATALTVMNKLWNCGLPKQELSQLGVSLGADVPIFIANQSSMAEGIGEKLTPYSINKLWVVLVFPQVSVSTAEVFNDSMLRRNQSKIAIEDINHSDSWINDCTPVVLAKHPKVSECFEFCSQHSKTYMSGTGSTLFAAFKEKNEAFEFEEKVANHYKTKVCESY